VARRLLLIQIDGLASSRLRRAIADGTMPAVAALSDSGRRIESRTCAVPPSTPVFQSALVYGPQRVVHGYAWFDRERGRVCRMDVPEDIARIEVQLLQHAGRRPLFQVLGAACYFSNILGGAVRAVFTIADGMLPRRAYRTERLVGAFARATARAPVELARGVVDLFRFRQRSGTTRFEWDWLAMRVLVSTYFEEISTTLAAADLRRGAPMVYIDFLAYDECAHRRGPDDPVCWVQLARIDRRIAGLTAEAQARGYEVMLCSDHGQAASTPYRRVAGRDLAADVFRACAGRPVRGDLDALAEELTEQRTHAARILKWGRPFGALASALAMARARHAARRLEREHAVPAGDLAVVTGGSIAHVYVGRQPGGATIEEIEERFPRLVPLLERSPGVGLVVVRRSAQGPLVVHRGQRVRLRDEAALARLAPFRTVGPALLAGILRLVIASETAGDLVLYGAFAPAGAVTFDPELGSHGGVHPDELDLFVIPPDGASLPAGNSLDPADLGDVLRARYGQTAA
jgi:hypothetical protein